MCLILYSEVKLYIKDYTIIQMEIIWHKARRLMILENMCVCARMCVLTHLHFDIIWI